MRRIAVAATLIAFTMYACGRDQRLPVNAPVGVATPPASSASPTAEAQYPSEGRIEAHVMTEAGSVRAFTPEQLQSITTCHERGRPLGWVLLRISMDRDARAETMDLVERGGVSESTAECVRAGLHVELADGDSYPVLIYARLL